MGRTKLREISRPVTFPFFKCPACNALYQVVRAEAGPESSGGEIQCRVCGGPYAQSFQIASRSRRLFTFSIGTIIPCCYFG